MQNILSIGIGLIVVGLLLFGGFLLWGQSDKEGILLPNFEQEESNTTNTTMDENNENSAEEQAEGGLVIVDVTEGTGEPAEVGDTLVVHYVGTLENGTKFDSSRDRDKPFQFTLGTGMVIQGWEQGMQGMRVGGVRKLRIPAELGYGSQGNSSIPPNATLLFEVELLEIK